MRRPSGCRNAAVPVGADAANRALLDRRRTAERFVVAQRAKFFGDLGAFALIPLEKPGCAGRRGE